jgi:type I restriction enzyme S subunit
MLEAGGSAEDAELAAMAMIAAKSPEELAEFKQTKSKDYQKLAQTAALFPSAMQKSELGDIPEGWEVNSFSKIACLDTSSIKPNDEPDTIWEHYSIPAFDDSKSPAFQRGVTIKSGKYKVHKSAVLSSKLNPHFPRTWWPDVMDENKAICSTEFMQFVPISLTHRTFIFSMITSYPFQRGIGERVTGSTGSRQRAQPPQVASMNVVIPSENLVEEYSQSIFVLMDLIAKNIKESNRLSEVRSALLPELLSGKIVPKERKNEQ